MPSNRVAGCAPPSAQLHPLWGANYIKGLQNMQAFLLFYGSRALLPDFPTDSN